MSTEHIGSFADFWPGYVRDHQSPLLRKLHFIGTTVTFAGLVAAIATRRLALIPLLSAANFGAARLSHFVVDGKAPAMQGHLLWALRADVLMCIHMLRGTMQDELARHAQGSSTAARDQSAA